MMNFFRRGDEKMGMRTTVDTRPGVVEAMRPSAIGDLHPPRPMPDVAGYEALGTAMEFHKQSSNQLLSGIAQVQSGMGHLIGEHERSLQELGRLSAEQSRMEEQLHHEMQLRSRLEGENAHLAAENRDHLSEIAQIRIEAVTYREEFTKLQAVHKVVSDERAIYQSRLTDAEGELRAQVKQYEEASALMTRAQQELDSRSRELARVREKLDTETTAHQLLAETAQRDKTQSVRELARLCDERSQLKASLADQESATRSLQISLGNSRQELAAQEDRYKRLEGEFENLQAASALERAQMSSRHEAMNSKVILAEKLLATANGRNRVTDDELHETKAELKRLKTDHATLSSRSERANEELTRIRALAAESEAARRDLSAQNNALTVRLRDAEETRARREREADILKRDMQAQAESDRFEIGQLRADLDLALAESRQFKTDNAILTGQLEAARHERARATTSAPMPTIPAEEREWDARPATALPIIDLSETALKTPSPVR
jgi:chromosome segregation ATPase